MSRPPWGNDLVGLFRGLSRIGSAAAEIRTQEITKAWATSSLRPVVEKATGNLQESITNALQDPQMVQANLSKSASEAISRVSLVAEGIKAYRTQAAPMPVEDITKSFQEGYDPVYDPNVKELSIEDVMMHEAMSGHEDHLVQKDMSGTDIIGGIGEIADAAVTNISSMKSEISQTVGEFEHLLDRSQVKKDDITDEYVKAVDKKLEEMEGAAFGYNVSSFRDEGHTTQVDEILSTHQEEGEQITSDTVSKLIEKDPIQGESSTQVMKGDTNVVGETTAFEQELSVEDVMMQEALSSQGNFILEASTGNEEVSAEGETKGTDVDHEAAKRIEQFDKLLDELKFEEREITQEHLQALDEKLSEVQSSAFGHDLRLFNELEPEKSVEDVSEKTKDQASLADATEKPSEVKYTIVNAPKVNALEGEQALSTSNSNEIISDTSKPVSTSTLSEKESAELELDNTIAQIAKSIDLTASEKTIQDFDIEVQIQPNSDNAPVSTNPDPLNPFSGFSGPKSPFGTPDTSASALSAAGLTAAAAATATATVSGTGIAATVAGGTMAAAKYQEEECRGQGKEVKTEKSKDESLSEESSVKTASMIDAGKEKAVSHDVQTVDIKEDVSTIASDAIPKEGESPPLTTPTPVSSEVKATPVAPEIASSEPSEAVKCMQVADHSNEIKMSSAVSNEIPEPVSPSISSDIQMTPQVIESESKQAKVEPEITDVTSGKSSEKVSPVTSDTPVPHHVTESVTKESEITSAVSGESSDKVSSVSSNTPVIHQVTEPVMKEASFEGKVTDGISEKSSDNVSTLSSDTPVTESLTKEAEVTSAASEVCSEKVSEGKSDSPVLADVAEGVSSEAPGEIKISTATSSESAAPSHINKVEEHDAKDADHSSANIVAATATAAGAGVVASKIKSVEQEKKGVTAAKPKPKLLGRKPLAKSKPKSMLAETAQARKVPHSRLGRMLTFGSLAAGLGAGTIAEMTRRTLGVNQGQGSGSLLDASPFLTEANAKRIVDTLCKVRGAALKLGQMMSIQDSALINPQVQKIFERVRQSADFMPAWQLEKAIVEQLGTDWRSKISSFDEKPFAAASIGQVHLVTLLDGRSAAMKIQYPGVAEGIESDINNLVSTLKVANIIPEGLYIDSVIEVAKKELGWECDYVREAACTEQYRELVKPYHEFYVPEVVSDLCTQQIFTSELIEGVPVDKCVEMDQESRNYVCEKILRLCLLELFRFGFMQTDPNWSNFFYNAETEQMALLDFGACRSYEKSFVDKYIQIIHGAASKDRGKVLQYSQELGFLTGYEAKVMEDAHIDAIMILGEAFQEDKPFQFGSQDTTHRIQHLVPVMLSHRMCAPPEESYSLHRKMSGVFLLCAKLNGVVNCKPLFEEVFQTYKFGGTWKELHASLDL